MSGRHSAHPEWPLRVIGTGVFLVAALALTLPAALTRTSGTPAPALALTPVRPGLSAPVQPTRTDPGVFVQALLDGRAQLVSPASTHQGGRLRTEPTDATPQIPGSTAAGPPITGPRGEDPADGPAAAPAPSLTPAEASASPLPAPASEVAASAAPSPTPTTPESTPSPSPSPTVTPTPTTEPAPTPSCTPAHSRGACHR